MNHTFEHLDKKEAKGFYVLMTTALWKQSVIWTILSANEDAESIVMVLESHKPITAVY